MSGTTISTISHVALSLTSAGQNPVTITSTGGVEITNGIAITGGNTDFWTIANAGSVTVSASNGIGIALDAGGVLANSGFISGGAYGVRVRGSSATITNAGTIAAPSSSGIGINLTAGGTVTNTGLLSGGKYAIRTSGGAATIMDSGTITGNVTLGGTYNNRFILAPQAVVNGTVTASPDVHGLPDATLELTSAASAGTLAAANFVDFGGIDVDIGATWTLDFPASPATTAPALYDSGTATTTGQLSLVATIVESTGTLTNYGTLFDAALVGGFLNNQAGGLIDGPTAIYGKGGVNTTGQPIALPSYVDNSGLITGSLFGVKLVLGGGVGNAGTIKGADVGIYGFGENVGTTIINSGTIIGGQYAIQLTGTAANRLIDNPGAVFGGLVSGGSGSNALELQPGHGSGTLANFGTSFVNFGTIIVDTKASWELDGTFAGTTIINDGTITNPITLSGANPVLVVAPGAAFDGPVTGPSLGGSLELAAGAATGTLSNFSATASTPASFTGFRYLEVDPRANWVFGPSFLLADGPIALVDSGTLTSSGVLRPSFLTVAANGVLTNAGQIVFLGNGGDVEIDGGTLVNQGGATIASGGQYAIYAMQGGRITNSGSIIGTGAIGISATGGPTTVVNSGTISGSQDAIAFSGSFADRVVDGPGGVFDGLVSGGAGSNVLELAAGLGTIANFGASFANFGTIDVDRSGTWDIGGTLANVTIDNAGTILNSLALGGTSDLVIITPTAVFDGAVNAETYADRLELAAGQGTLNGLFSQFSNFGTLGVDAGGIWQINGSFFNQTISNAGTITDSSITFADNSGDRIIVDPGAVFDGIVTGGRGSNVLELGAGTSIGTLEGFGTSFANFGTVTFDINASWLLDGAGQSGQTITLSAGDLLAIDDTLNFLDPVENVDTSDTIDLRDLPFVAGATASYANGFLSVTSGRFTYGLAVGGLGNNQTLTVADDGSPAHGAEVVVGAPGGSHTGNPCFASGSRILTTRGEIAVEALAVGDLCPVMLGRRLAPVRWIGRRVVACGGVKNPAEVMPVRIRAGAFGPDQPRHDLVLSPEHAVFVDDVLIPVRHLINDVSIVQETVETITYWHIQLDCHEVLLAEGLTVESYLEAGSGAAFETAPPAGAAAMAACAELVEQGARLEAVRARLAERVGVGAKRVQDFWLTETGTAKVDIEPGMDAVRLRSGAIIPPGEKRRLGAALAAVVLDDVALRLDDPALARGLHAPEGQGAARWRWTDGEAIVAASGARSLTVRVVALAA